MRLEIHLSRTSDVLMVSTVHVSVTTSKCTMLERT